MEVQMPDDNGVYEWRKGVDRKLERHDRDLYFGNEGGKDGLTTRMRVQEECMERISQNLGRITWLIVGILASLIANFIFHGHA
jgi:hypothetical protein